MNADALADYLSVRDIAQAFGVSQTRVHQILAKYEIPVVRTRLGRLYAPAEIVAFCKRTGRDIVDDSLLSGAGGVARPKPITKEWSPALEAWLNR